MVIYIVWEDSPAGYSSLLSVHRTKSGAEVYVDDYPGPKPTITELELLD